jgi:glycosyltransferase involved in cell wall biosynthesis
VKLGVFSQWYDPEPGPARLPGVYARALAARGHDVRVLTGFPNYPTGRLYPGYKGRFPMTEVRDGLPVRRLPLYPNHGGSAVGRVLNYTSFALSATALASRDFAAVDAMWVYNSPATVGLPLLVHGRRHRTPYLLHVQDLWPESVVQSGMLPGGVIGSAAESALRALVARTEAGASGIAVISPSVEELLVERGVPRGKITYVPNPTDESLFYPRTRRPELRRMFGSEKDFVILYAGSIGHVQSLDSAIHAMSLLRDRLDIRLAFVGSGIAEASLKALVSRLGLTSVTFHGRAPQEEIPDLMAAADVQLVSLRDDPFLAVTTPSKLQSILASSQPVLAALSGDGADLVRRSGSGVVSRPGDSEALAIAMLRLADQDPEDRAVLGAAGRAYYYENMSATKTAAVIEDILQQMMGEPRVSTLPAQL